MICEVLRKIQRNKNMRRTVRFTSSSIATLAGPNVLRATMAVKFLSDSRTRSICLLNEASAARRLQIGTEAALEDIRMKENFDLSPPETCESFMSTADPKSRETRTIERKAQGDKKIFRSKLEWTLKNVERNHTRDLLKTSISH